MLQPLDILVCLKIVANGRQASLYEFLASELRIGLSGAHRSVKRLQMSGLLKANLSPVCPSILELLVHGVRYVYYVKPGEPTRGVPTAHAAPPLSGLIAAAGDIPVWPDAEGTARGYAITPLHKSAPAAALRDEKLYELLALVDAIRIGRSRERVLAEEELRKRLGS